VRQPASNATLTSGTVLSKRYRVEQLIGSGGYASVYRATDLTYGYERAIKEVTDPDENVRKQFKLEAELLIHVNHPNVPRGYEILEDHHKLYLVMDYVQGKDLEELLNESLVQRKAPLEEDQVLTWAIAICDALETMHRLKTPVIHRDIKPANIKITPENQPILIDFGLAKVHAMGPTHVAAQGVSPGFAPPEQYMAKGRTDARTDIYALGATLYACLTGKDPPEAPGRLLAQTGVGGPNGMQLVPLRRSNPRVSETTERVIMKALELSPGARQQSAAQLRNELAEAQRRLRAAHGAGIAGPSSSMARGSTAVMGAPCPRCGTPNRPDAQRCVNCHAPLPISSKHPRTLAAAQAAVDVRPSTQMPVVNGPARGAPAALGQRGTAKQQAVAVEQERRTAKQQAIAAEQERRTGKQPVAAAAPVMAALPPAAPAAMGKKAPASKKAGAAVAEPEQRDPSAWLRFGPDLVSGFGKTMLAAAAVEALWGALVIALGVIALMYKQTNPPVLQMIIGWMVVVLLVSVLGAQALTRPVYRKGFMPKGRRVFQGFVIIVYSLAVQAAGIWGVFIFQSQQANPTLAMASYILFGISSLIGGIVGVLTVLG
jgi:tRNA A-37 threonylcarbamoyl transferase component Bud32